MKLKVCRDCKIEKSTEDFYTSKKAGSFLNCKECIKKIRKHYRLANKAIIAFREKRWRKLNGKQYYIDNRERELAKGKAWRTKNADAVHAQKAQYKKENPHIINAINSKRRAAKLQRIPKWLTSEDWAKIEEYYFYASLMSQTLGIPHEVDHIIPMQGENISGLHVPENLQILTARENEIKNNKYPY